MLVYFVHISSEPELHLSCAEKTYTLCTGAIAYIGNVEGANKSQVSHGSVVRQHHEIEACSIIVDDIWRNHSPEIEEVALTSLTSVQTRLRAFSFIL